MRLLAFIIFTFFFICCTKPIDRTPIWCSNQGTMVSKSQYNYDVKDFVERRIQTELDVYKKTADGYDGLCIKKIDVVVDTIIYSKDLNFSIIFFADYITYNDNVQEDSSNVPNYFCSAAIRLRNDTSSVDYYDFSLRVVGSHTHSRVLMNNIENLFLQNMQDWYVLNQNPEYGYISYNLRDSLFFEESVLFKKVVNGLYGFQIEKVLSEGDSLSVSIKHKY